MSPDEINTEALNSDKLILKRSTLENTISNSLIEEQQPLFLADESSSENNLNLRKMKEVSKEEIKAKKIWEWISEHSMHHPDMMLKLYEFRLVRGGAYFYKEISDLIYDETIPDLILAELLELLTDVYEGGEYPDKVNSPINDKDVTIQSLLTFLLNNPRGALSNEKLLDYIYMVYDQQAIIEFIEGASFDDGKLSTYTKAKYRLRHLPISSLSETLEAIETQLKPSEIRDLLQGFLVESSMSGDLSIIENKNQIKDLLKSNEPDNISIPNTSELIEGIGNKKVDLDEFKRMVEVKEKEFEDYAAWVKSLAILESPTNIEQYIYNSAVAEKNINKKISLIEHLIEQVVIVTPEDELEKVIFSTIITPEIRSQLESYYLNSNLSEDVIDRIDDLL